MYEDNFYAIFKKINRELWAYHNMNNSQSTKLLKMKRFEQFLQQVTLKFPVDILSSTYTEFSQRGDLIEGVEETINRFAKDIQLVIISNGPSTPRVEKLHNSRIAGKLKFFSSESFDGKFEKPNPQFYRMVLSKYNISNKRILAVGDKLATDILGANNAGLDSVWFPFRTKGHEDKSIAKPTYTIERFSELVEIVYVT
jgi:2-haloacid dehalogenase